MKITKVLWLFGVLCVCAVWGGTVFADTCNPGEYMVCSLDPQYGSECNDCGCATCPPGQTSDGTGFVSYCPNQSGSTGCYTPTDHCPGYTTCPSGVGGSGKKCKEVSGCSVTGCQRYAICNTSNGAITYQITGPCHLENGTCYSNHRNCNLFEAIVDWGSEWNNSQNENEIMKCLKTEQSGIAEWKQNKWDVSGCRCKHNGLIWYKNCTGVYVMKPRQGYSLISKVSDEIDYECEPPLMYYCKGCVAGAWIGETIGWPVYSGTRCSYSLDANGSDDLTGTYTVCSCSTVDAGYYSTGCNFSYPLHSITNPSGCKQSCPAGYSTPEAGATSENDCEFDTSALFHDATGDFTLGNMTNCPTNGG